MNPRQFCIRGHDTHICGRIKRSCRACLREWRKNNPAKAVTKGRNDRYRRFGIVNMDRSPFTVVDYDRAYQTQSSCCAGCGVHQSAIKTSFHADHNHVTGVFRFLLCGPCNQTVGLVKEQQSTLRRLADLLDALEAE